MWFPILYLLGALALLAAVPCHAEAQNPPAAAAQTPHYAVTILSSFEPIPDALVPKDFKGQRIYRAQAEIFGKTIYFVRMGFFANHAQALAKREELAAQYPGAFVTELSAQEFAAFAPPPAKAEKPAIPSAAKPAEAPASSASTDVLYTITLAVSEKTAPQPTQALPEELRAKRLYLLDTVRNGVTQHSLQLGFFGSAAEAETALRLLTSSYPGASFRKASAQEQNQAKRTVLAIPATSPSLAPPIAAPTTPATTGGGTTDQSAADLLERSRAALTRKDYESAINFCIQLLQLPPNRSSQDAQELVGLAYERNAEPTQAKKEYALYLRLYPEGEGAERVRQRLANLETAPTHKALATPKRKEVSINTAYGSVSQIYYRGNSHTEITENQPVTLTPPQVLSGVDESSIINTLDITGRFRNGDYDNRVVVRDTYRLNFLKNRDNLNRLYAAYAEVRNKPYDIFGRIGRQSGNSGGVLGRFDGISLGYGILPKWHINLVAGEPVEFNPINSDRLFWGANVDFGTFAEHWNGNFYYINQTVDGIADRQAIGNELRYFDPLRSVFTLIDYDILFGTLNIGLLQANQQIGKDTNLSLLIDHRKSPILQTANSLNGESNTSVRSFLSLGMTEEQLRALADARTQTYDQVMIGVTHNFNPTWQLGGDIKWSSVTDIPGSGAPPATVIEPMAANGDLFTYTVQGIGTGLLTKRDVSVLSLSHSNGDLFVANAIAFNNRNLIGDRWTLDISLTYYQEQGKTGVDQTRLVPTLRSSYRWREKISFELEYGMEITNSNSTTQITDGKRSFYSLGYRWDF